MVLFNSFYIYDGLIQHSVKDPEQEILHATAKHVQQLSMCKELTCRAISGSRSTYSASAICLLIISLSFAVIHVASWA